MLPKATLRPTIPRAVIHVVAVSALLVDRHGNGLRGRIAYEHVVLTCTDDDGAVT